MSIRSVLPALLAAVLSSTALAGATLAGPTLTGQVRTDSGPVRGVTQGAVQSFKGIAFAQPPVGALRWRAPQPPAPWQQPFVADRYGHDCAQLPFPSDAAPLGTAPDEDCLVLNVWRPAAATKARRPVVVWIYGGGFVNGGSSPAVYDGSAFARAGLVFVSFNYRLGRFGFFAHPQLSAARPAGEALGNYGYMDQLAALRWVQRNIGAFGGDPANVTVVGESAGGGSVHMLLAYGGARGLFRRAVVMSGGGRGGLMGPRRLKESLPGSPSAEAIGVNFAKAAGIAADDPRALEKLRALPAQAVVAGLNMATMMGDPAAPTYAGPMQDGEIVTEDPDALYARGLFNHAELMVGATSADIGFSGARTKDEVYAPAGPLRARAEAAYDPQGTLAVAQLAREVAMDGTMLEPARHVARLFAQQGVKSWLYRFSYVASSMEKEWRDGAPHATDIPYFFDTVAAKYGKDLTPRDQHASDAAFRMLVAFAKDGQPGRGMGTAWPPYAVARDGLMDLRPDGKALWGPDPRNAKLDVIEAVAAARADKR